MVSRNYDDNEYRRSPQFARNEPGDGGGAEIMRTRRGSMGATFTPRKTAIRSALTTAIAIPTI